MKHIITKAFLTGWAFFLFAAPQPVSAQKGAMEWENRPDSYQIDSNRISMLTQGEKYLWGDSHQYDFDFPYSHFYYREMDGDFVSEAALVLNSSVNFGNQGIMLKAGGDRWIKFYISREYGSLSLNSVNARSLSDIDYSTMPLGPAKRVYVRALCKGTGITLSYSLDNRSYTIVAILNIAREKRPLRVGLMADSPMSVGFEAVFEGFGARKIL